MREGRQLKIDREKLEKIRKMLRRLRIRFSKINGGHRDMR